MSKPDKTAEAPRILPDLTPAKVQWRKLPGNVSVARDGDFLTVRLPMTEAALTAAQPSKSGALCMVAGGGSAWHKLDDVIGIVGARLNISFGIPNPAFDKEAAKRRKLLAALKSAGITAADLAA